MVSDFVEELGGLVKLTDAEFEREITHYFLRMVPKMRDIGCGTI